MAVKKSPLIKKAYNKGTTVAGKGTNPVLGKVHLQDVADPGKEEGAESEPKTEPYSVASLLRKRLCALLNLPWKERTLYRQIQYGKERLFYIESRRGGDVGGFRRSTGLGHPTPRSYIQTRLPQYL